MKKLIFASMVVVMVLAACGDPNYQETPVQPIKPETGHHTHPPVVTSDAQE